MSESELIDNILLSIRMLTGKDEIYPRLNLIGNGISSAMFSILIRKLERTYQVSLRNVKYEPVNQWLIDIVYAIVTKIKERELVV